MDAPVLFATEIDRNGHLTISTGKKTDRSLEAPIKICAKGGRRARAAVPFLYIIYDTF